MWSGYRARKDVGRRRAVVSGRAGALGRGRWAAGLPPRDARRRRALLWFIALALLLCDRVVSAHAVGDSQLQLDVRGREVLGSWRVRAADLRAGHLVSAADAAKYLTSHLRLVPRVAGSAEALAPCPLVHQATAPEGGDLVVTFRAPCVAAPERLNIRYDVFFEQDVSHRGRLRLSAGGVTHSAVFTAIEREQAFELGRPSSLRTLVVYTKEGLWHIFRGYDHLLFLVVLLLPAARMAGARGTPSALGWRYVAQVVTAFTVAHSITLSAVALGWLAPRVSWIEVLIALSIAVAALANCLPTRRPHGAQVAFAFGLIHGFGFAGALRELGLVTGARALSLLGFNLGVELGQLAVVALVLAPVGVAARRWLGHLRLYDRLVVPLVSVPAAALAVFWAAERFSSPPEVPPTGDPALLAAEAQQLSKLGRYEAAANTLAQLQSLYTQAGDAEQADAVALALAETLMSRGAFSEASTAFERVAARLEQREGWSLAATAYRKAALAHGFVDEVGAVAKAYRAAAENAARAQDPTAQGEALEGLAAAYATESNQPGALAALERAIGIYQETADPTAESRARAQLAATLYAAGDFAAARDAYEAALAAGPAAPFERAAILRSLARVYGALGDPDGAAAARARAELAEAPRARPAGGR